MVVRGAYLSIHPSINQSEICFSLARCAYWRCTSYHRHKNNLYQYNWIIIEVKKNTHYILKFVFFLFLDPKFKVDILFCYSLILNIVNAHTQYVIIIMCVRACVYIYTHTHARAHTHTHSHSIYTITTTNITNIKTVFPKSHFPARKTQISGDHIRQVNK